MINQLQVIIRQPNVHTDRLKPTIDVLAKDWWVVTDEGIVKKIALILQKLHHII